MVTEDLLSKTKAAMEQRLRELKAGEPPGVLQYNLVLPVTAEQLERIIRILESK